jgi:hypothetical protein
MKLIDYQAKVIKTKMTELVDLVHDTVYGAFSKGVECALNHLWIPVEEGVPMPEDFEDLIKKDTTPARTKSVTCRFVDPDDKKEKIGMFYRGKTENGWEWLSSITNLPTLHTIIKWKNV